MTDAYVPGSGYGDVGGLDQAIGMAPPSGAAGQAFGSLGQAAAGFGMVGATLSGLMSLFSGFSQQRLYNQAAGQARAQAGVNADEALIRGDATTARAATQAAANGGGFAGSSLGVIRQLAARTMFNARMQTYRGLTSANEDVYQGEIARDNGINSLIGSEVQGAANAASELAGVGAQQQILGSRAGQLGEDPSAMYMMGGMG